MNERPSPDDVLARVQDVLVDAFEIGRDEVRLEAHVVDDLDLDSIDAIDLAIGLRERMGIDLSEKELKSIRYVRDIVDLLKVKLGANRPAP